MTTNNTQQESQEVWQAYDNMYFLQLNLERLSLDELDEIIKTYFVKDGENGVKMDTKYKHTVLVKESRNIIE